MRGSASFTAAGLPPRSFQQASTARHTAEIQEQARTVELAVMVVVWCLPNHNHLPTLSPYLVTQSIHRCCGIDRSVQT